VDAVSRRGRAVGIGVLLVLGCGGRAASTTTRPVGAADRVDAGRPIAVDGKDDALAGLSEPPESCVRMQAAFDELEACAVLSADQRAALEQAEADGVAAYSEACLDADCDEDSDRAWREEASCTRTLDALATMTWPCPLPP
jgi:hypothetical protein